MKRLLVPDRSAIELIEIFVRGDWFGTISGFTELRESSHLTARNAKLMSESHLLNSSWLDSARTHTHGTNQLNCSYQPKSLLSTVPIKFRIRTSSNLPPSPIPPLSLDPYLHNDLHLRDGPPDWPGGNEAWRVQEPVNAHSHLISMLLGEMEVSDDSIVQCGMMWCSVQCDMVQCPVIWYDVM